jgi:hypothetical protein
MLNKIMLKCHKRIDIQHQYGLINDIQRNSTQLNDTPHKDAQHNGNGFIETLSRILVLY